MGIYTHTKSLSTRWQKFLNQVHKKFDNRFDYSNSKYINANTPITILCPDHGPFEMIPWVHSASTTGCPACSQSNFTGSRRFTKESYIRRCEAVHGNKFNYDNSEYNNMKSELVITCPTHGIFKMIAWLHLKSKHGCPSCGNEAIGRALSFTKEKFILEAQKVHGDKFNYSKVEMYNNTNKVIIICRKHGEFKQLAQSHLGGVGCPKCASSKGEDAIRAFLDANNIRYIAQHKFPDCKRVRCLKFDFYLPDYHICIEYDGEGHFRPIKIKDQDRGKLLLKYAQENDQIKTSYCKMKGIPLLRIDYSKKNQIAEILTESLQLVLNK